MSKREIAINSTCMREVVAFPVDRGWALQASVGDTGDRQSEEAAEWFR
jgi:hypothetical protein